MDAKAIPIPISSHENEVKALRSLVGQMTLHLDSLDKRQKQTDEFIKNIHQNEKGSVSQDISRMTRIANITRESLENACDELYEQDKQRRMAVDILSMVRKMVCSAAADDNCLADVIYRLLDIIPANPRREFYAERSDHVQKMRVEIEKIYP